MILESLKRKNIDDDKLWEMVDRANKLTAGSYSNWDDNADTLVPLMDRILIRAKEKEEWQVYFYAMAKFFWLVGRTAINDIHRAFRISEMFHRDSARHLGENVNAFTGEWRVNLAANILSFYLDYPLVDDAKIEQMLEIFLDNERRYGSSWNRGDYHTIMWMALMNQDKKLAETARKKLAQADFKLWCYVCYYGKPMIGYYALHNDFEGIEEMITRLCERSIPAKYQWCFAKCECTAEEDLVSVALQDCLKFGSRETFDLVFAKWENIFQEPKKKEVEGTHDVLFHALAGDWSQGEARLHLAGKDDRDAREKRDTPLNSLLWALCWHCYFRMLDKTGVETVRINLGETAETAEEQAAEYLPEWTCLAAAEYFERQADEFGVQMDKARKRFNYARIKRTYEECFLRL